MLCKNSWCMAPLTQYQWGDGYCSRHCMSADLSKGEKVSDYLHDPTDPTGRKAVAKTADEVDAFLEAHAIDPRLPKIIYLKRRGATNQKIGDSLNPKIVESMVRKILEKCDSNLLRRCGLRRF